MCTLGERLEREEPVQRVDLAIGIGGVATEHGEFRGGGREVAPQCPPLGGGPLLEAARARVEALEQRIPAELARGLQRFDGGLGEEGAQLVDVHLDLREVERHLLPVRLDERVQLRGQRAAQGRQRLPQAGARELRVGVFPEQRGEALAALRGAVLQREEGEECARLAGRDLERPAVRAPQIEAAEQAHAQHGPQAYRETKRRFPFKGEFPL